MSNPSETTGTIYQIIGPDGRKGKPENRSFGSSVFEEKKFGALLAVAAGSDANARMVVLEHDPGNTSHLLWWERASPLTPEGLT